MSLLSTLTSEAGIQEEKDTLGNGSFVVDSGVYNLKITLAYITKAASGALGLVLHTQPTGDKRTLRETLWLTSGTAKGGKNYYEDKNGEKRYLPGFAIANAIAQLTLGKEISQLDTEEKVVNLYSYDAGKEVPTKVNVITDLLGQEFTGGVLKQIVDKNVKDATGAYVPSGETREENVLDKIFSAEGLTLAEQRAGKTEGEFLPKWKEKWTGQINDRSTKGVVANTGTAGAPAASSAPKTTPSLFG